MKPKVAVVIVNWNGYRDTIECLKSLKSVEYDPLDIIVVDNGSVDGSVNKIFDVFGDYLIIQSHRNLGFTGGNNLGIKIALSRGCKYLFILNNDTVIEDHHIIDKAINYLESNNDVGIVSPVVLRYSDKKVWFRGGDIDRNTGIGRLVGVDKEYVSPFESEVSFHSFINGCAMIVRAEILSKTQGFHEEYFLTSEESELCIKAIDMGYKLAVLEDTVLLHKVSRSMGVSSPLYAYFSYRNKLLFVRRNAVNFNFHAFLKIVTYYLKCFLGYIRRGHITVAAGQIRGVLDYFRGRFGKGHYENIL